MGVLFSFIFQQGGAWYEKIDTQSMAAAAESAESAEEEPGMLVQIVSVAIFAVFYLVTMVLTNFCNVAF